MIKNYFHKQNKGFTLIEMLVVISIIAVLIGLSILGLQGARTSSRDARRKADLEQIRSGLELYRADCDVYLVKASGILGPGSITGFKDPPSPCSTSNVYISQTPIDPTSPARDYRYSSDGVTYELCASLEQGGTTVTCGGSSSCGSGTCNYKVTNP